MTEPATPSPEVDAYLAELPPAVGELLGPVRAALLDAIPDAEESLAYGMPAYRIGKTAVIFFAAWKDHWSLHAVDSDTTKGLDLTPGRQQRDTIKFPLTGPAPLELVAELARRRAAASRSRH